MFSNVILAILDSVMQKLKIFGKIKGQERVNKKKRQRTWFCDKFDKKLKWLPF